MTKITHNGKPLTEILEQHRLWIAVEGGEPANLGDANLGDASLRDADLGGANLVGANLVGADLWRANLNGVRGDMRHIKTAQFDRWPLTWTTDPEGIVTLQIGCQRHPLALWEESDPRWIATLDSAATAWWAKYRDVVLALVKASPAERWGQNNA